MKYALILSLLVLTSCVTKQTRPEIGKMSNAELCEYAAKFEHDSFTYTTLQKRNLSCHPAEVACKTQGIHSGNSSFNSCVKSELEYLSFKSGDAIDQNKFGDCVAIEGTISCYLK